MRYKVGVFSVLAVGRDPLLYGRSWLCQATGPAQMLVIHARKVPFGELSYNLIQIMILQVRQLLALQHFRLAGDVGHSIVARRRWLMAHMYSSAPFSKTPFINGALYQTGHPQTPTTTELGLASLIDTTSFPPCTTTTITMWSKICSP